MSSPPSPKEALRGLLRVPPVLWAVIYAALIIQCTPWLREALIYDRALIAAGEWWRLWTGHLAHFGWAHFAADVGLLSLLAILFAPGRHWDVAGALILQPLLISGALFWLDPEMPRYAGLSAVNLGLLLTLAVRAWSGRLTDWLAPAIVVIYAVELGLEVIRGGHGGGAIPFDDPTIRVATSAHLTGVAYASLALGVGWLWRAWRRPDRGALT